MKKYGISKSVGGPTHISIVDFLRFLICLNNAKMKRNSHGNEVCCSWKAKFLFHEINLTRRNYVLCNKQFNGGTGGDAKTMEIPQFLLRFLLTPSFRTSQKHMCCISGSRFSVNCENLSTARMRSCMPRMMGGGGGDFQLFSYDTFNKILPEFGIRFHLLEYKKIMCSSEL